MRSLLEEAQSVGVMCLVAPLMTVDEGTEIGKMGKTFIYGAPETREQYDKARGTFMAVQAMHVQAMSGPWGKDEKIRSYGFQIPEGMSIAFCSRPVPTADREILMEETQYQTTHPARPYIEELMGGEQPGWMKPIRGAVSEGEAEEQQEKRNAVCDYVEQFCPRTLDAIYSPGISNPSTFVTSAAEAWEKTMEAARKTTRVQEDEMYSKPTCATQYRKGLTDILELYKSTTWITLGHSGTFDSLNWAPTQEKGQVVLELTACCPFKVWWSVRQQWRYGGNDKISVGKTDVWRAITEYKVPPVIDIAKTVFGVSRGEALQRLKGRFNGDVREYMQLTETVYRRVWEFMEHNEKVLESTSLIAITREAYELEAERRTVTQDAAASANSKQRARRGLKENWCRLTPCTGTVIHQDAPMEPAWFTNKAQKGGGKATSKSTSAGKLGSPWQLNANLIFGKKAGLPTVYAANFGDQKPYPLPKDFYPCLTGNVPLNTEQKKKMKEAKERTRKAIPLFLRPIIASSTESEDEEYDKVMEAYNRDSLLDVLDEGQTGQPAGSQPSGSGVQAQTSSTNN